MADDTTLRVAVYVTEATAHDRVLEMMQTHRADDINDYGGMVTGWLSVAQCKELMAAGLPLEESSAPPVQDKSLVPQPVDGGLASDDETPGAYRVSLRGPFRPAWDERLRELGVELTCKVGEREYKMMVPPQQVAALANEDFVVAVKLEPDAPLPEVDAETRYQKAFDDDRRFADAPAEGEPRTYEVVLHQRDERARDQILDVLRGAAGVRVIGHSAQKIRFEAQPGDPILVDLTRNRAVDQVHEYRAPALYCTTGHAAMGGPAASADVGLTGAGEVVGVLDSSIAEHPDLEGAVRSKGALTGCLVEDTKGHGTHVAGIIAGRGTVSNGAIRGVAPGAQLAILSVHDGQRLQLPVDWQEMLEQVSSPPFDAKILNLSWGYAVGGAYTEGSAEVDRFVYEHPDVLVVIAAGNDGNAMKDGKHEYATIGAPATAKNAITVGACATVCDRAGCPKNNLTWGAKRQPRFPKPPARDELVFGRRTAGISSRGPTRHESVKPDVLAPGVCVESLRARGNIDMLAFEPECPATSDMYICATGTSMAAPFVSGAAALLREWLRRQKGNERPSAALLKGLLIASARPIDADPERVDLTGFPDFDQGYGAIDLRTLLPVANAPSDREVAYVDMPTTSDAAIANARVVQAGNNTLRTSRTFEFRVPTGAVDPVRVVLTYTDYPGAFLQNKLGLHVMTPKNGPLYGNHEHKRHAHPLLGRPLFDPRNNVQLVTVAPPQEGLYRIQVVASETIEPRPESRQGFALVVAGQLESLVGGVLLRDTTI
jgi:subtilisin family serine protease